jgi:hypothetical protein
VLPAVPSEPATPSLTAPPPGATPEPTASPSPSATFTLTPTATESATPTATPIPSAETRILADAAQVEYLIPLTLQHLTPDAALLFFQLLSPSPGYVIYRMLPATSEVWWIRPLDPTAARHFVTLEGLLPDQRYEIQVGLGEDPGSLRLPRLAGQRWGPLTVRTPPLGELSLRIGVIGDTGFGEEVTDSLIARMAQSDLDFVIHTGDLMYRPQEEDDLPLSYALKFYLPFQPLLTRMPVYSTPGNHDLEPAARRNGEPFYYTAFPGFADPGLTDAPPGPGWYAFTYGSTQFLMLNSLVFHGQPGRQEHTAWLSERLFDPKISASIIALHVPPFNNGRHANDGRASRIDWVPLFEQAGVPLVFAGHDHNYQRLAFNGVTYVITGGGSSVLYGSSVSPSDGEVFRRESHFVLLELEGARLRISALDPEGDVLDRETIELQSQTIQLERALAEPQS